MSGRCDLGNYRPSYALGVALRSHPFEACCTAYPIQCLGFASEATDVFRLPGGVGDHDLPFRAYIDGKGLEFNRGSWEIWLAQTAL
jgi:hypothetical protein